MSVLSGPEDGRTGRLGSLVRSWVSAVGGCGGFCDWVSFVFEKYRVLRNSPFDRGRPNGGAFVLRGFGATVAYEGLGGVENY